MLTSQQLDRLHFLIYRYHAVERSRPLGSGQPYIPAVQERGIPPRRWPTLNSVWFDPSALFSETRTPQSMSGLVEVIFVAEFRLNAVIIASLALILYDHCLTLSMEVRAHGLLVL